MLYGRSIQSKQVDKVAPFQDPLKTLKLKTLASHCGNQKGCHDNALAHFDELYMLHPLISAHILET